MNILITGGAGFIGSRLAKRLAGDGHSVTILDNLIEQVHGAAANFPSELARYARCVRCDICDIDVVRKELIGKDTVVHFAAQTGTGQSMYRVNEYARTNLQGTATLLDLLINDRPNGLTKLLVASSRAVYGEGKYQCNVHGIVYPHARTSDDMSRGEFEPKCPICAQEVSVLPTSEDAVLAPSSFYGLTKQVQEQMVLMFASMIGIDAFALRYQNVYGPGQSLLNSYTGLLGVFSNLARQGRAINVFEDGLESRDFIYIDDAIAATTSCLAPSVRGVHSLNVGSGVRTSVYEVAEAVKRFFNASGAIEVTRTFRAGDIRHNAADTSKIKKLTGFQPKWGFLDGLKQFLVWAERHAVSPGGFEQSLAELRERGLLGGAR